MRMYICASVCVDARAYLPTDFGNQLWLVSDLITRGSRQTSMKSKQLKKKSRSKVVF